MKLENGLGMWGWDLGVVKEKSKGLQSKYIVYVQRLGKNITLQIK